MSGSGISWAICKSASRSRQITTPAPTAQFFTGQMPFLLPNQQCQSTEGKITEWKCSSLHFVNNKHITLGVRYIIRCRVVCLCVPVGHICELIPPHRWTWLHIKFSELAFSRAGLATWNALPVKFQKLLKSHYFSQVFNICWFLCFSIWLTFVMHLCSLGSLSNGRTINFWYAMIWYDDTIRYEMLY